MAIEKRLVIDTSGAEALRGIFHGRGPIEIQYGGEQYSVFLNEGETADAVAQRIKLKADARDDIVDKAPDTAESYGLTVDELASVLARAAAKLKNIEER